MYACHLLDPDAQGFVEPTGVDGLGEVVIHARVDAPLAIATDGIRGQCDDGDTPPVAVGFFLLANPAGRLEPVHLRHGAIHEHEVVVICAHLGNRLGTVVNDLHFDSRRFEEFADHHLIDGVVLGDECTGTLEGFHFPLLVFGRGLFARVGARDVLCQCIVQR